MHVLQAFQILHDKFGFPIPEMPKDLGHLTMTQEFHPAVEIAGETYAFLPVTYSITFYVRNGIVTAYMLSNNMDEPMVHDLDAALHEIRDQFPLEPYRFKPPDLFESLNKP